MVPGAALIQPGRVVRGLRAERSIQAAGRTIPGFQTVCGTIALQSEHRTSGVVESRQAVQAF